MYLIHTDSIQRLAFSVDAEVRKRGANMKRRIFIASFGMAATIHPRLLIAQSHMAQVAFLFSTRPQANPPPFWQALIEAMRQRGWVEGRNITFHLRAAEGIQERYEQLATELVALHPDVIVSPTSQGIQAARERTNAIPIVMAGVTDPLGAGFIASLARPGGNITGVTNQLGDLGGKFFQILQELRPGLSRIAILWNPDDPGSRLGAEGQFASGLQLGLTIQSVPVRKKEDLDVALTNLANSLPEALLIHGTPILFENRSVIVAFALQHRLPSVTASAAMAQDGVLASYSPDQITMWRRGADYIDRILKGANPAEMPVEQPINFELIVNLKTARAIDLDVPWSLLTRADELIE
jgi:putative tryptophan/tyrosine transport system substrate-binding protein